MAVFASPASAPACHGDQHTRQLAGWLAAFDAIRDRVWAARMIACASKSYSNHGSATLAMVWRIVGAIPDIAVKSWNAALRRAGYNHSMCRGRLASEQLAAVPCACMRIC